jgi:Neocarzinostatin family
VSGGLVATSSIPQPQPVVAVSPSTKLVDLQSVLVVGSHFSANASLGSVECKPGAVDVNSCDLSTLIYTSASPSGAFKLHRAVRRIINVNGLRVDCASSAGCILGVGNISNYAESSGAILHFDPKVPPVPTKLTGAPATGLRDHQLIAVTGQGFNPGTTVSVVECVAGGSFECAYETNRSALVSVKGTFSMPNFALERMISVYDKNGPNTIDCAAAPKTCVLEAQSGYGTPLDAPLSFNPSIPPVIPALSVAPSTKLADLQLVQVRGYGFLPGVAVSIEECSQAVSVCAPNQRSVTAGFQGQFTITMSVERLLAGAGQIGVVATDCASHLGACTISAFASGSSTSPSVSLAFDRKQHPATPTIEVVPNTQLTDNQRVGVTLGGFGKFAPVEVLECSAEAVSEQNLGYCDQTTAVLTNTPASGGSPTVSFFVRRQIGSQNGLVDCGARAGACVLVATASQFYGYYGGVVGGTPGTVPVKAPVSALARPATKTRALPAPDLVNRPAKAANGSHIPGLAVAALRFRP